MASASPVQVKVSGATLACRAAPITVEVGASLPTKPEAPASIAAKSCSSPAYMVRTTRPT